MFLFKKIVLFETFFSSCCVSEAQWICLLVKVYSVSLKNNLVSASDLNVTAQCVSLVKVERWILCSKSNSFWTSPEFSDRCSQLKSLFGLENVHVKGFILFTTKWLKIEKIQINKQQHIWSITWHGGRLLLGDTRCDTAEYPENAFCMRHSFSYLPLLHQLCQLVSTRAESQHHDKQQTCRKHSLPQNEFFISSDYRTQLHQDYLYHWLQLQMTLRKNSMFEFIGGK